MSREARYGERSVDLVPRTVLGFLSLALAACGSTAVSLPSETANAPRERAAAEKRATTVMTPEHALPPTTRALTPERPWAPTSMSEGPINSGLLPGQRVVHRNERAHDSFVPFPPFPGTQEEDVARIQRQIELMESGGRARKRAFDRLRNDGILAVPPLVNQLNGIDLNDPTELRDAWEILSFVERDLTHGMISIPFRGDLRDDPETLRWNEQCLESLLTWVQRWYSPGTGREARLRTLKRVNELRERTR